jgi:hypothetical protein
MNARLGSANAEILKKSFMIMEDEVVVVVVVVVIVSKSGIRHVVSYT